MNFDYHKGVSPFLIYKLGSVSVNSDAPDLYSNLLCMIRGGALIERKSPVSLSELLQGQQTRSK